MRSLALFPLLAVSLTAACSSSNPEPSNEPIPAAAGITAHAEMRDLQGRALGMLTLSQTPQGVLISGELTGLPAGVHGVHLHDAGRCDPPFTSAGGHFNPTQRQHGFRNRAGFHAGDLPAFSAPASGSVRVDRFTPLVSLGTGPTSLLDADGSSLVVHASVDDYLTDPAGNSGERIACGVIAR